MKSVVQKWGYRWDRRIFTASYYILLVLMIAMLVYFMKHDKFFFECSPQSPTPCKNPFYTEPPFPRCVAPDPKYCNPTTLRPGETLGEPFPAWIGWAEFAAPFTLILPFIINHFMHNGGFRWKKRR